MLERDRDHQIHFIGEDRGDTLSFSVSEIATIGLCIMMYTVCLLGIAHPVVLILSLNDRVLSVSYYMKNYTHTSGFHVFLWHVNFC